MTLCTFHKAIVGCRYNVGHVGDHFLCWKSDTVLDNQTDFALLCPLKWLVAKCMSWKPFGLVDVLQNYLCFSLPPCFRPAQNLRSCSHSTGTNQGYSRTPLCEQNRRQKIVIKKKNNKKRGVGLLFSVLIFSGQQTVPMFVRALWKRWEKRCLGEFYSSKCNSCLDFSNLLLILGRSSRQNPEKYSFNFLHAQNTWEGLFIFAAFVQRDYSCIPQNCDLNMAERHNMWPA